MSTSLQDGYRWASVTPDDYSGALYVATFLSFTYTSTTVLARVLIKSNMLGADDGTMVAAQSANVVQFTLLISSLSSGLAKSYNTISDDQYSHMAKTLVAGQVAIYLTLGLSKVATVLIVHRLFTVDMRGPRRICNIIVGTIVVWTVASAILVSAGCSAASISPRTPLHTCPSIGTRYLVVTITDAITDILLTVTPAYLCRRLHMDIRLKLQVLGIFALRLPLVVLSVLFFRWWKHSFDDANPGIARTVPLVYQQCQLCISIIAGTIPSLKAFLQSFDTGSGIKAGLGYTSNSSGYRSEGSGARRACRRLSSRGSDSYQMERLRPLYESQERIVDDDDAVRIVRKLQSSETRRALTDGLNDLGCSSSHGSEGSETSTQELFIRKEVHWEVTSEVAQRGSDVRTLGLL